jgi:hypothetical protein
MYISGVIKTTKEGYFVCAIKTPRMIVEELSVRSRLEALTEALKFIGLPMESNS